MSPLRWTTKSTRRLASELTRAGHRVSADTVAGLLREEGFSLQGNAKTIGGAQHPDRDAQFRYINERAKEFQAVGNPVVSVDTKKKELVGNYKNAGLEWHRAGDPVRVRTHDFPDAELGKAIPYGIYDLTADTGWVSVGTDHDTAAFAVSSVRRWWHAAGRTAYPHARRLLITADAGGSNGYRTRAWKFELAALAVETGTEITVCHFPPGTSKWNRIEHRLFSHIAMNWRGRPLTSHDVIVNSIAATTTRTGLTTRAELDTAFYATGVRISDGQLKALPLDVHDWHGEWNYTLRPEEHRRDGIPPIPPQHEPGPGRVWLTHTPPSPASRRSNGTCWSPSWRWPAQPSGKKTSPSGEAATDTKIPAAGLYTGRRPGLTLVDRLLATILYQRFKLPQIVITPLFAVTPVTLNRAISQTRRLLHDIGHTIEPSSTHLAILVELTSLATHLSIPTPEIKTASY
ncbi:Putative IS3 family ISVisp1-like transposase (plasmid) [Streptomyces clavuligerus]|uniref:Putative IS3 family ISVisp1-like transposase n=1 Tax=Streptomyces clavuligerus TaxID=1901 RepID=B5GUE5_STRCL|nr:rhodopirellula transposase family protein [Streptomyces clavuligerus]EFG03658.1 Putative IS3 family ISVisp1-like transposase [Streptomyces clavuligerus]